ncbi:MAG: T9SS type A sorting domain-containing protein [Ignavibacteria bacterium]|nr:T9SS type A sorting domain-containing protein [Ignavibacteria bacterium]
MKKLFLALVILLMSSANSFPQLTDENFDYPAGDSLQQHGWVTIGTVFNNRMTVVSPGLSFPVYVNSGIGNAVTIDTNGQDVYKDFSSPKVSGNIFASFLVNVKTAKAAGDYFVSLLSSTSTTSLAARVYAKDSLGNIAFGLAKTTETVQYSPFVYSKDSTYLMILKYSINAGSANDSVSLFVYNSSQNVPSSEPLPSIGPKGGSGADLTDAGRFALRQGTSSSSPRVTVDGIFVTTSWDNTALPVELSSFNYETLKGNVTLHWTTSSEINNAGFDVERSDVNGQISNVWSKAGFISGNGTSSGSINYSFTDNNLSSGKYNYRLKQIDYNGNYEYFSLNSDVIIATPKNFFLGQNYPNPFNPSTVINYNIPQDSYVKIKLYDNTGREVLTLLNEFISAGYYTINFNVSDLASGIYFYNINAGEYTATKKMMLVR